jgi:hypothetical protein
LRFTVEVAADQATQALTAISTAVNQAGVQMKMSLAGVGPAARGASTEISGLGGQLRSFANEQRSQGRMARFYAAELASIIPVAGDTANAIRGLANVMVEGLAGGVGIGMGLAVAQLIVSTYKEIGSAAEQLRAKFLGWRLAAIDAGLASNQALLAAKAAAAVSEMRAGTPSWDPARQKLLEAEIEAKQKLAGAELEVAAAQVRAKELREGALRLSPGSTESIDAMKRATEAETQYNDALKMQIEIRRLVNAQMRIARQEHEAAKRAASEKVSTEQMRGGVSGFEETPGKLGPEDLAKLQKDYNKDLRESIKLSEHWGEAIGSAIGMLITGQASAGEVAAQIGRTIIQSVVQAAIAQVTANAAAAASGAAASQAPIPIIGPVLAISAMGAMMSAVLGLLASIPSARGGWWDTGAYEGLMRIHRRETVLAAPDAEDYRRGRAGGGGTVNINVVDARGMERLLRRNRGALGRATLDLARDRRDR